MSNNNYTAKNCVSKYHVGNRKVSIALFNVTRLPNVCKSCISCMRKQERIKNKKRIQKEQEEWRAKNKNYTQNYNKKYRSSKEGKAIRQKLYEKNRQQKRDYDKARWKNNAKHRARHINVCATRRSLLKKAIPPWHKSEEDQILKLYLKRDRLTKETGIMHHVDHIVPLQNKKVCGLHCLSNLRIITQEENNIKGNKLLEEVLS